MVKAISSSDSENISRYSQRHLKRYQERQTMLSKAPHEAAHFSASSLEEPFRDISDRRKKRISG